MSHTHTGNPALGVRSPAIGITQPDDGDGLSAASSNVGSSKLADFVAFLQLHAADQFAPNAFTDFNDFQGNTLFESFVTFLTAIQLDSIDGDSSPLISTTSYTAGVTVNRKLLWEIQNDNTGTPLFTRLYAKNGAGGTGTSFEVTVNAVWVADDVMWAQDNPTFAASKYSFLAGTATTIYIQKYTGAVEWADNGWSKTLTISPDNLTSIDTEGLSGTGAITQAVGGGGLVASGATSGDFFKTLIQFRKAFPSNPSMSGLTSTTSVNVLGTPVILTPNKWGALMTVVGNGGGATTYFGSATFT